VTKKKLIRIVLIFLFSFLAIFIYSKLNSKKNLNQTTQVKEEEKAIYSSNIIKGVNYTSTDLKGMNTSLKQLKEKLISRMAI